MSFSCPRCGNLAKYKLSVCRCGWTPDQDKQQRPLDHVRRTLREMGYPSCRIADVLVMIRRGRADPEQLIALLVQPQERKLRELFNDCLKKPAHKVERKRPAASPAGRS